MHGRSLALVRFLARRALSVALVVFIVASATLLLSAAAQGDFVSAAFGLDVRRDTADRLRAAHGLDRPVTTIYTDWLAHAVRFDFGQSLMYQRPVAPLVAERVANTSVLAAAALVLAVSLGIPAGMLSGSRGGILSTCVRAVSALCLSVPPLIAAILLVALAAATGFAPVGGMTTLSAHPVGWLEWAHDLARHVPLPALALALPFAAMLERVQAQAIAQALAEPCMLAALARGLSARQVLWRHAWRVGAKPVAAVGGLLAGTLLSGSFAVELVTSWPGLGRLTYDALVFRDFYLASGCATAAALLLAAGVLASDLLVAAVDPRVALAPDTAHADRMQS